MDAGLYESLLTERFNAALAQRADLHAEIGTVDDAEQSLSIVRHLSPLIERQLTVAGSAEARAQLLPQPRVGRWEQVHGVDGMPDVSGHQRPGDQCAGG